MALNLSALISAISRRTLRITRRPAPLSVDDITRVGGRVHALVRGDASLRARGARNYHDPRLTPMTRELNHARSPDATGFPPRNSPPQTFHISDSLPAAERPALPAPTHDLHERHAGGASGACRCYARDYLQAPSDSVT
jgi:hypothetical protein